MGQARALTRAREKTPVMDMHDRLEQIANGFMESKILLAAAELRIFDLLGDGRSSSDMAAALGAPLRGVEILLDALAAIGLCEKSGTLYRTRPEYAARLVESERNHYPSLLRHRNRMFRGWSALEAKVLDRRPDAGPNGRSVLTNARDNENFIRAMASASAATIPAIVDRIDLAGVRRLADVGGGPGAYLAAFCARSPALEAAYLVDVPLTVSVARRLQAGGPDAARMRYVEWDFYADEAPEGLPPFDLVFLSQVVHAESPEANAVLFLRLAALLAPGGRLVVHERTVEEDRSRPAPGALFAVNMLAMTEGGRTYTDAEISSWGAAAGLKRVAGERVSPMSYLLTLQR